MQTLSLQNIVATGALLLLLLISGPAYAQNAQEIVPYEVLYSDPAPEEVAEQGDIQFESNEVVQELPDHSVLWLDGRVSFNGGEYSTSERQQLFANAHSIPFIRTDAEYRRYIRSGHLVRLEHPLLVVGARRPYVLPSTAQFIYAIVVEFNNAGCGRLRVNDAMRLISERPANGSPFSVHPAGMALDLRVINLSERCHTVLSELLHAAEAEGRADATREWFPEHFHVVVVPELQPRRVYLSAEY